MFSGPKATSSSTIVATIWLSGFWNTIPAVCLMSKTLSSLVVSMPSIHTEPSVGISNALMCFANDDLPEPLCPNMVINCPASTSKLTLSIALNFESSSSSM